MTIFVSGIPVPQGSMSAVNGHIFHQHSAALKAWREAIGWAFAGQPEPYERAVSITLSFRLPRPKAHRDDVWVITKPDLDKLCRAVLDGLTGVAYNDDSQVVYISAVKSYESDGAPVGVTITVDPM